MRMADAILAERGGQTVQEIDCDRMVGPNFSPKLVRVGGREGSSVDKTFYVAHAALYYLSMFNKY